MIKDIAGNQLVLRIGLIEERLPASHDLRVGQSGGF